MEPVSKTPKLYNTTEEITTVLNRIDQKFKNVNSELLSQYDFDKITYNFWSDREPTLMDTKYMNYDNCWHFIEVQQANYINKLVAEQLIKKFNEDRKNYDIFIKFVNKFI